MIEKQEKQLSFERPGDLIGPKIILEPLSASHREALRSASASNQSVWKYFPIDFNGAGADFDKWFDFTTEEYRCDRHFPFAVRRRADGQIIGTTRFYDLVYSHRRLAIGSTWYISECQGGLINSEVRLLQLSWAFDLAVVNRVELITDTLNLNSQAAMRILGAVEEGTARSHMVYKDGRIRDSVLFSIVESEWGDVRRRLLSKLSYSAELIDIS